MALIFGSISGRILAVNCTKDIGMKTCLTGTKTPTSIFSVSVRPSESVGNDDVELESIVELPNVVVLLNQSQ